MGLMSQLGGLEENSINYLRDLEEKLHRGLNQLPTRIREDVTIKIRFLLQIALRLGLS